ncbi:MAG: hypothetical protein HWD85_01580 [Flavobacteriaceae bacterium]|nr:hypothetical protein [Flavobacteriaceae bacterium]
MKLKNYKSVLFLIAAFFISGLQAQKYDKKYNETFKVNKDVLLEINATNADIEVTTWNKNQVAVNAVITVEGLSKQEAQKFLKNWEFEALGNQRKVSVNANANKFLLYGGKYDFNFDFSNITIPEIEIPEINIEIPEINIEIPEITIPEIKIPEINIDFDEIFENIDDELDEYDFDNDEAKTFTYTKNGKKKKVVIKSKEDWEKFKKSKEYQAFKKDLKSQLDKAKKAIKNIDTKKIKEEIKKAKIAVKKVNKEKLEKSLAKAKAQIEKMKVKMAKRYRNGENVIIIEDGKSKKKVKITRKITIKVPKDAKFDLNTRHSKVKLPKGKTSGKVSYGTFNANEINGGNLNIYNAPFNLDVLNGGTLRLHNITDATIASVMNSRIVSNSSKLKIGSVNDKVDITSKFGELLISEVASNLKNFTLKLHFSDAIVNFKNLKDKLNFSQVDDVVNVKSENVALNGNFSVNNNNVVITGKQSKLIIKRH